MRPDPHPGAFERPRFADPLSYALSIRCPDHHHTSLGGQSGAGCSGCPKGPDVWEGDAAKHCFFQ